MIAEVFEDFADYVECSIYISMDPGRTKPGILPDEPVAVRVGPFPRICADTIRSCIRSFSVFVFLLVNLQLVIVEER